MKNVKGLILFLIIAVIFLGVGAFLMRNPQPQPAVSQASDLQATAADSEAAGLNCHALEAFPVDDPDACERCPNRKAVFIGGTQLEAWDCVLKTCPASHPISGDSGSCFACDYLKSIFYLPEKGDTGAEKCPNRSQDDISSFLTVCPETAPLRDGANSCYPCGYADDVYTSKEKCAVCPNRQYDTGPYGNGRCFIK